MPVSLLPTILGVAGAVYGVGAALLGAVFLYHAMRVARDEGERSAKRMFAYSILYLFGVFAMLIVDRITGLL